MTTARLVAPVPEPLVSSPAELVKATRTLSVISAGTALAKVEVASRSVMRKTAPGLRLIRPMVSVMG